MKAEKQLTAVEWFWLNLTDDLIGDLAPEKILKIHELIEQAKAMQDEQMQLTWNNAIDAVQKDKWHSYYEFYNNNFKSE